MELMVALLWVAAVLHGLVAAANAVAVRMLRYPENIARMDRVVAQVFVVQNVFIVLALLGSGVLCAAFARDLAGASGMGRYMSALLSVSWALRLAVQLFYYDAEARRRHMVAHMSFIVVFLYLVVVFALGATGWLARGFPE